MHVVCPQPLFETTQHMQLVSSCVGGCDVHCQLYFPCDMFGLIEAFEQLARNTYTYKEIAHPSLKRLL